MYISIDYVYVCLLYLYCGCDILILGTDYGDPLFIGSVLAFTAQFVRIYFHLFCSLSFWLTFFFSTYFRMIRTMMFMWNQRKIEK